MCLSIFCWSPCPAALPRTYLGSAIWNRNRPNQSWGNRQMLRDSKASVNTFEFSKPHLSAWFYDMIFTFKVPEVPSYEGKFYPFPCMIEGSKCSLWLCCTWLSHKQNTGVSQMETSACEFEDINLHQTAPIHLLVSLDGSRSLTEHNGIQSEHRIDT